MKQDYAMANFVYKLTCWIGTSKIFYIWDHYETYYKTSQHPILVTNSIRNCICLFIKERKKKTMYMLLLVLFI